MGPQSDWLGDFNPGEALGVGLDTRQLGHLAGSLFLALFSLSALRRAQRAAGLSAAVWVAVAIGLLAGAVAVAARGFADQIPEELRPWVEPDMLARAAAVLAIGGLAVVLVSAHWVRRPSRRFVCRLSGLALGGVAVWLAAVWFADDMPEEIRPWAARTIVTRGVVVGGLVCLAGMFWLRPSGEASHATWARRVLTPPSLALAVVLAVRWFAADYWPELAPVEVNRIAMILAAVATGRCVLIAWGAYVLRDRPGRTPDRPGPEVRTATPPPTSGRRLPVAVLLDEQGRPVAPEVAARPSQSRPAADG